jgi:N-acetylglutamate synthase-like GNAT family acetyltransferase
MGIRKAILSDRLEIVELLNELDYNNTESFIEEKLMVLINHRDEEFLVYEEHGKVIACISIHFIPQIALKGDFARISYFSVDKDERSKGIGREMEEYCVELARKRKCDRIEVHSHFRRAGAHKFYSRQGYVESPKYLIKSLN